MNRRETSPATSTGWAMWAAVKTTAPFSEVSPVPAIISRAISSQGRLALNWSVIQASRLSKSASRGLATVA